MIEPIQARAEVQSARQDLAPLVAYFLKLGTIGFGGPVALAGYMQRDLVERRRWIAKEDYAEGLALAQLASQRFPLEKVTTHRFGLKDVDLAIRSVGGQGVPDVIHASLMPWR